MKRTNLLGILFLTIALLLSAVNINAQHVDEKIKKITIKLRNDKNYLNLNYLVFQFEPKTAAKLQNIPRVSKKEPYSFLSGDDIQYQIVFLNKGIELDSIYLMYVNQIKINGQSNQSLFAAGEITNDTTEVLSFKDLYFLRLNNSQYYYTLLDLIKDYMRENDTEKLPSLLKIDFKKREDTYMGMSSLDNTDYFNYQKIMNPHYVPENKKKARRGRSKGETKIRTDVSFSRITFSTKAFDFKIGSTGFEVATVEPILNLLPLESSNIFVGFRSIFRTSNIVDVRKASYIDAKLFARININQSDFFSKQPFVIGDTPKLNLNTGFGAEFRFTRLWGLPYLTIKAYIGGDSFTNPTYTQPYSGSSSIAYYSNTQFESTFSFYWNSDVHRTNRFRFDFGFAYFDIWKAIYNSNNQITSKDSEGETFIVPVLALKYIFVPSGSPLLGAQLRIMDTRLTAGAWLKVFEFNPKNTLRFEFLTITEPMTRSLRAWESKGGYFFQLRYRYGL